MSAWTREEDETLIRMAGQGRDAALQALPHRSLFSLKKRAFRLGVKFGRRPDVWTDDDDRLLRDGVTRCLTWAKIAGLYSDRTVAACMRRWQRISTPVEMGLAVINTNDATYVESVIQAGGFSWSEVLPEGVFHYNYRGEVIGHRAVAA